MVDDSATTFLYDGDRIYEPNNYHEQYHGAVTVRYALEHSLNVPTIKIAEHVGYDRVASLAKRAGMSGIQEWLSFYFKAPMHAREVYPEHDLFIQLMKLKNTLRHMQGEAMEKTLAWAESEIEGFMRT